MTTSTRKVKATTRQTITRQTPTFDVRSVTRRTQSRSGEAPTPDELRVIEAAFARAMSAFCQTDYARTPSRRKRGVRAETRQQAEKFETMVGRWVRAEKKTIVAAINHTLAAHASSFTVTAVEKATSKSFDLELRFRRTGERRAHRLPVNVKVNSKQKGLSLVAGELALTGYGCTGSGARAVRDAYAAWRHGDRGNGYLVLAYIGSADARAEQVVFYNPVLMDPKNWEWNLRYPQLQADHLRASAAYRTEKLPETFDQAGARFLVTLAARMQERLEQRAEEVAAHLEISGLAERPRRVRTRPAAARGKRAR